LSFGVNEVTTYGPVPIGCVVKADGGIGPGGEDVLRQDAAALRRGEVAVPAELWLLERDLHSEVVHRLDVLNRVVERGVGRLVRGVDHPLPGEDDVVGREWLAVTPQHALQQRVRDAGEIGGHQPVLLRRHLRRQAGDRRTVRQEVDQRLGDQAGGKLVLEAAGQLHVQRGRRLPLQDLQVAARAACLPLSATGGRVGQAGARCRARRGILGEGIAEAEQVERNRRGESEGERALHEAAAREASGTEIDKGGAKWFLSWHGLLLTILDFPIHNTR